MNQIKKLRSAAFRYPLLSALVVLGLGLAAVLAAYADSFSESLQEQGKQVFRYDTFGDEQFWTNTIHLDQAVAKVSPATALSVGLKVDSDALNKAGLLKPLLAGQIDLNNPANTLALIKANAVLGVVGHFDRSGNMTSMGITCALCHSTVDNSISGLEGKVGKRLDGWANRDLNVGAIIDLAPDLTVVQDLLGVDRSTVDTVLHSWGPGHFDAELFFDGKAFNPDTGKNGSTLIPPAYGLQGINLHTWTGWGSVPHWNNLVAVDEMHGQGNFEDRRLDNAAKFPIAAKNGFGHVHSDVDLVTPVLPALQAYQLSIPAPDPPSGSFDPAAAARGRVLFSGKAQCASCHVPGLYTEGGYAMHTGEEVGIDDFQANRSPDGFYRTSPLRGLWAHQTGGFYHDGRFATLMDVVNHYDTVKNLGLTDGEKSDIVEFLKSLGSSN